MAADYLPRSLPVAELGPQLDPATFGFQTTSELEPLEEIVGQPRAERAFEIGVGIRQAGYHLFVSGISGSGRMDLSRRVLARRAASEPVPQDWVYVNNFDDPDEPKAIALPVGQGARLQREMTSLVARLLDELPKAFQREDYNQEKEKLRKAYQEKEAAMFADLQKLAEERSFAVQQMSEGQLLFQPLKDGQPITDEEAKQLSGEEIARIGKNQQELLAETESMAQRQQEAERQFNADLRQIERSIANGLIEPLLKEVAERYQPVTVSKWLTQLQGHFIRNLERFRRRAGRLQMQFETPANEVPQADLQEQFFEYQVNLVVDNSAEQHAPVVFEPAPNYRNLFGTMERVVDRFGRTVTNFSRIKAGSLLRANGGYLLLDLEDALQEPFVWKHLKRALKTGQLQIEINDPLEMISSTAMRPEPIPLDVKLVVLGSPLLYYLLYLNDDDFRELFKIKAEFDTELQLRADAAAIYGRLVRKLSDCEGTLPFNAGAVAELIWESCRLAGDRRRLSAEFRRICDLIREASYWARSESATVVDALQVRRAVSDQAYRSDLIGEKMRGLIADGTLKILLHESRIASVHGLTVADLGDVAVSWPVRLTASIGVGMAGLINIERESHLSGRTFDKGMLILEGYLRNQYAEEHPLALSASIALEQTYGGVDGDSASTAELLCLLSALARVPLRQDIAVTGSINQLGEIQAIGAVTEKVEGFYDICREVGLTGQQGVCIPASNVKHLVPRYDVRSAIARGQFHIWPIEHVDEAIALMAGAPAGCPRDESTFHGKAAQKLRKMSLALKEQQPAHGATNVRIAGPGPELPHDPRPPMPGRTSVNSSE